jgi:tetratricopeptide (TPR) repeat protein
MRLDPHYPFFYLWTLGHAFYLAERRQEALDIFAKIIEYNPNFVPAQAYRAVVLSELGRVQEGRAAWDKAGQISPGASLSVLRARLPYKRSGDLDRFLTEAHRVGMP